jgi:lipoate-protein ligase B
LSYFNWIIACEGEPVTSMERLLGREVDLREVEDRIIENFVKVFEFEKAAESSQKSVDSSRIVAGRQHGF